jgi:nucleoside phosphorylase
MAELIDRKLEMDRSRLEEVLSDFASRKEYLSLRYEMKDANIPIVPAIQSGLVVSGSAVVADNKVIKEVLKRFPSAVGLEMEIFGLYTSVEGGIGRRPEFIALKTAADFGTSTKKDDAQKLASSLSAEMFRILLTMMEEEKRSAG